MYGEVLRTSAGAAESGHKATERRRAVHRSITTHCCFCAMGCAMTATVDGETGEVLGFKPHPAHPVNRGRQCMLGHAAPEQLRHRDRLLRPLIRHGGRLKPAAWEEALDLVARRWLDIRSELGAQALGVYSGGSLTTEKCYLLGKFARVAMGTPNVDYNGRFCMSAASAALNMAFGVDRGLNMPLEDLAEADCLVLVGTNAAETLPVIMSYFQRAKNRGARIIGVDLRLTWTARLADMHLPVRPGTDLALANGLLHVLVRENLVDLPYIAARTRGFEAVKEAVEPCTPARVAAITGVPEEDLVYAARLLGRAERAVILTGRGCEQHSKGVETVLAWINLALATGRVGRPGSGFGTLTGQANGQGGREHGLKADQLPGFRSIEDAAARRHVAEVWGIPEALIPGKGKSAYELLAACGSGEIRGLFVLGSNPAVSAPDAGNVRRWLGGLDFLVVVDPFLSETAQLADVVLPGSTWAEEEGTVTNLEGRVLLRRRVADPPRGVRTDTEILQALARRLGAGAHFFHRSTAEVFEELRAASRGGLADYSGISYSKILLQSGVFWPCPGDDHPGTPRMFQDGFPTADGRAAFHPVRYQPAAEQPEKAHPLHLTTGRVIFHYLSGNQTRRLKLADKYPEPLVEIHPDTARNLGLREGRMARLRSLRGEALFRVKLSPHIRRDTVFVPIHWGGEEGANNLTNPALDPVCRMPEFKVCAVRAEPAAGSAAGGGIPSTPAGGWFAVLKSKREMRTSCTSTVS